MKFTLRTLLILVTIACILLGGRIEYLRRRAAFHKREALRLNQECNVARVTALLIQLEDEKRRDPRNRYVAISDDLNAANANVEALNEQLTRHWNLYLHYERAAFRPWMIVDKGETNR